MAAGSVPPRCGADAAGLQDASRKVDVSEGSLGDAQAGRSPRLREVQGAESGRRSIGVTAEQMQQHWAAASPS